MTSVHFVPRPSNALHSILLFYLHPFGRRHLCLCRLVIVSVFIVVVVIILVIVIVFVLIVMTLVTPTPPVHRFRIFRTACSTFF